LSRRQGWIVEGADEKGTYLIKNTTIFGDRLRLTIRSIILQQPPPNVCLRMFAVSPFTPGDAEVVASLFAGALDWYYVEEEGGKVFFWAKSVPKIRFNTLSELEDAVVSSIEHGVKERLAKPPSATALMNEGWLVHETNISLLARKTVKIRDKLAILDAEVEKIGGERRLKADLKILTTSPEEAEKIHSALQQELKGYRLRQYASSPLFHTRIEKTSYRSEREADILEGLLKKCLKALRNALS